MGEGGAYYWKEFYIAEILGPYLQWMLEGRECPIIGRSFVSEICHWRLVFLGESFSSSVVSLPVI